MVFKGFFILISSTLLMTRDCGGHRRYKAMDIQNNIQPRTDKDTIKLYNKKETKICVMVPKPYAPIGIITKYEFRKTNFKDFFKDVMSDIDSISITQFETGKTKTWRKIDSSYSGNHLYNPSAWIDDPRSDLWLFVITNKDLE